MYQSFCNANWVDGSTQKDTIIKNVLIAEKSAVENSTVDFFTTNGERHPQQVADIALSTLFAESSRIQKWIELETFPISRENYYIRKHQIKRRYINDLEESAKLRSRQRG